MSASKFRDVTNGTVNSSDDFKKQKNKKQNQPTVFSCPASQNKVYCGVGGSFFLKKEKGV